MPPSGCENEVHVTQKPLAARFWREKSFINIVLAMKRSDEHYACTECKRQSEGAREGMVYRRDHNDVHLL